MKIVRLIVIALVFTGLAHSCTNRNASEVAEKENQKISYDDSVYCFNGRWRIISNGLEGLSDGNGNVLIEPLYDEIYFLNDNIAVLERSGLYYLASRDGRVFAEGTNKVTLEASASEQYEKMLSEDLFYWDGVLDKLEELGKECLRGNQKSQEVFNELKKDLLHSQGYMTESQVLRFENIVKDFKNSK